MQLILGVPYELLSLWCLRLRSGTRDEITEGI